MSNKEKICQEVVKHVGFRAGLAIASCLDKAINNWTEEDVTKYGEVVTEFISELRGEEI